MATTIASLGVSLFAKTGRFNKGMKGASRRVNRFSRDMKRNSMRLKSYGTALTGLAVGGGIGALIKRSFSAIDANAKLADTVGLTTQRLAGMQHQANLSGIAQGTLNSSLIAFTKRMGEARQGMGPLFQTLSKTNPELMKQLLLTKSNGQAMDVLADHLSSVSRAEDQAAISNAAFSRSGVVMTRMLKDGAQGLSDAQAEADKLGVSINRIDAAKVEIANDAVTRMRTSFEGLATQAAVALAPIMQSISEHITNIGSNADEARGKTINFMKGITHAGYAFMKVFQGGKLVWRSFVTGLLGSIATVLAGINKLQAAIRAVYDAAKGGVKKAVNKITNDPLGSAASFLKGVFKTVTDPMGTAEKIVDKFKGDNGKKIINNASKRIAEKEIDSLKTWTNAFKDSALDYANLTNESISEFLDFSDFSSIDKFFKKLESKSTITARQIAEKIQKSQDQAKLSLIDNEKLNKLSSSDQDRRTTFARAIDLDRVVVGGQKANKKQVVTDPQLETTNELLKEQNRIIKSGRGNIAVYA